MINKLKQSLLIQKEKYQDLISVIDELIALPDNELSLLISKLEKSDNSMVEYTEYVNIGNRLILRDALPSNHELSTYNFIKNQGKRPEDYGVFQTIAIKDF